MVITAGDTNSPRERGGAPYGDRMSKRQILNPLRDCLGRCRTWVAVRRSKARAAIAKAEGIYSERVVEQGN
jgi:hypothetical protein